MLSGAQMDEVGIVHAALGVRKGVMLDVGAHHGSSLAEFARDGWQIHAFEPDRANRATLDERFGRHPNVTVVPKAVSDRPGTLNLYTSAESSGVSSLTPFTPDHRMSELVEVVTLCDYLSEAGIDKVDFLKIDVEGFELNVLAGYDWSLEPRAVVVEFEDAKTRPLGYSWTELADELVSRGYELLVSEWFPIERYGVRHRWRRLARYPTVLADAAGWGNLIAAKDIDTILTTAERAARRHRIQSQIMRPLGR